jgi:hypothetical protein
MSGRHQHERHGGEAAGAALHQLGYGVRQWRRRQLDEAAADRQPRIPLTELRHERAERIGPGLVTGAMADEEECGWCGRGHRWFSLLGYSV